MKDHILLRAFERIFLTQKYLLSKRNGKTDVHIFGRRAFPLTRTSCFTKIKSTNINILLNHYYSTSTMLIKTHTLVEQDLSIYICIYFYSRIYRKLNNNCLHLPSESPFKVSTFFGGGGTLSVSGSNLFRLLDTETQPGLKWFSNDSIACRWECVSRR